MRAIDESQIYARLTQIFRDVFDDESIDVTSDLAARDVDGWDSIAHIRLMLTIEKAFKIKFSTLELGRLQDVGGLVKSIEKRSQ
jgi:acyl carrier protein